jgi:hypothetical protein
MPAYARLKDTIYVFPDAVKVQLVAGQGEGTQMVFLQHQTADMLTFIRLGEGDFVTVGQEPTTVG